MLYSAPVVWLTLSLDALALLLLSFLLYSVQYALQRLQASGGLAGAGRASCPHPLTRPLPPCLQMNAPNYFVWLAAVLLTTCGSFFLGFSIGTDAWGPAAWVVTLCAASRSKATGHKAGRLAAPTHLLLPQPIFPQCWCQATGQRHSRCSLPSPWC